MIVEAKDLGSGIRLLTLNRPPANAINRELNDALLQACRAVRDDESVRAVIVTGAGKFFSAGLDLKEAASGQVRMGRLAGGEDDGIFALWTKLCADLRPDEQIKRSLKPARRTR